MPGRHIEHVLEIRCQIDLGPSLDSKSRQGIEINAQKKNISINNKIISEFDTITLDGHSGEVIEGIVKTKPQEPSSDLKEILNWCKEIIPDKDMTDSLKIINIECLILRIMIQ